MTGRLFLVATPIGNLEDISLRALRILREADRIAAEDTRQSRKLLLRYEIDKPLISYYAGNQQKRGAELLAFLAAGEDIALICDAGTPGISDPGEEIAALAIAEGYEVMAIPGASALLTALAASGLPTASFAFEGFLPREKARRRQALEGLKNEKRTLVFYEAPHRLIDCLADMEEIFGGERRMAAARELTKIHEEYIRGSVAFCREHFLRQEPRGEFTLVIAGAPVSAPDLPKPGELAAQMQRLMAEGLSRKAASKELAQVWGIPAKNLYALSLKEGNPKGEHRP